MLKSFPGFSPKALTFFRQLAKNNDHDWFAAHKEQYETFIRRPMIELVALLCDDLRKFAPDYVPDKPEKVIYRIYRDTRFSKDKTPYKTHMGVHFQHRQIPKNRGAGFYFQVSHEGLGLGGGIYVPEPEQIAAVRQALAKDCKAFEKLCAGKALIKAVGPIQGESLARVPKGFDPESPAANWLRRKQIYFYIDQAPAIVTTARLYTTVLSSFKLLYPAIDYLNGAIIQYTAGEEEARPKRPEPMF